MLGGGVAFIGARGYPVPCCSRKLPSGELERPTERIVQGAPAEGLGFRI